MQAEIIFPILGFVTSSVIALSPFNAVKEVVSTKNIASVNTFPLAMMTVNAMGFALYGLFARNTFVFAPNLVGYVFGMYYVLSCHPFASEKDQKTTMIVLIGFGALTYIAGAMAFLVILDQGVAKNLLGITAVLILVTFYGSPLSTLSQVCQGWPYN
jgi:hypothetical protein